MKTKRSIPEVVFLILLSGLLWVLSKAIPIHKVEYIELDWNPGYKWTAIGIFICYLIFNHLVLRFNIWVNMIYSTVSGLILFIGARFINYFLIAYLVKLDEQKTPLGWEFKYKWLDLLFFACLLILLTELMHMWLTQRKSKT